MCGDICHRFDGINHKYKELNFIRSICYSSQFLFENIRGDCIVSEIFDLW